MTAGHPHAPGLYVTERGSGPPLLLVHGGGFTGEMFAEVLEGFAAHHRVIVPDLRGHGRSRDVSGPYTARDLASDLPPLLERLGIGSTAVLGFAHGGLVAQQFARDWPRMCDRLVLVGSFAHNMATPRERVEGFAARSLLRLLGPRRFGRLLLPVLAKELGRERAARLAGTLADQDRGPMLATVKETLAFDSRPWLGEISCPTLIVTGSADREIPMHHPVMLHEGIRGSRLAVIDKAGHTLMWTHPDEVVQVTEAFLLESGGPSTAGAPD